VSLKTNVVLRISDALLVQITNHGVFPVPTTVNDARLDAAIADVESIFLTEVGVAYDDTDPRHVPVGVQGVVALLHAYTAITSRNTTDLRTAWNRAMISLAATRGSEKRLLPSTSSRGKVSVQRDDRLVDYDRNRWEGFVPNMPRDSGGEQFGE